MAAEMAENVGLTYVSAIDQMNDIPDVGMSRVGGGAIEIHDQTTELTAEQAAFMDMNLSHDPVAHETTKVNDRLQGPEGPSIMRIKETKMVLRDNTRYDDDNSDDNVSFGGYISSEGDKDKSGDLMYDGPSDEGAMAASAADKRVQQAYERGTQRVKETDTKLRALAGTANTTEGKVELAIPSTNNEDVLEKRLREIKEKDTISAIDEGMLQKYNDKNGQGTTIPESLIPEKLKVVSHNQTVALLGSYNNEPSGVIEQTIGWGLPKQDGTIPIIGGSWKPDYIMNLNRKIENDQVLQGIVEIIDTPDMMHELLKHQPIRQMASCLGRSRHGHSNTAQEKLIDIAAVIRYNVQGGNIYNKTLMLVTSSRKYGDKQNDGSCGEAAVK
jgi:hypothetical protein